MDYKRLFLRIVAKNAAEAATAIPLYDALFAASVAPLQATTAGSILKTMANNQMVEFMVPAAGHTITAFEIAQICEELISLHEEVEAALVAAGTAEPADADILTEMLARMQSVTALPASSFIGLRLRAA